MLCPQVSTSSGFLVVTDIGRPVHISIFTTDLFCAQRYPFAWVDGFTWVICTLVTTGRSTSNCYLWFGPVLGSRLVPRNIRVVHRIRQLFVALVTRRLSHSLSEAQHVASAASPSPFPISLVTAVALSAAACRRWHKVVFSNCVIQRWLGCKELWWNRDLGKKSKEIANFFRWIVTWMINCVVQWYSIIILPTKGRVKKLSQNWIKVLDFKLHGT